MRIIHGWLQNREMYGMLTYLLGLMSEAGLGFGQRRERR